MIVVKYPSHVALQDDIANYTRKAMDEISKYSRNPTKENAIKTIRKAMEVMNTFEGYGGRIACSDLIREELREMHNNISRGDGYNTQEYLASVIQFCEYLCRAIANGKPRKKVL